MGSGRFVLEVLGAELDVVSGCVFGLSPRRPAMPLYLQATALRSRPSAMK